MQTEDKNLFGEALIAEIKMSLQAYEMPYTPGTWEDFYEKERRRKYPVFWIAGLSCVTIATIIGFVLVTGIKEVPSTVVTNRYGQGLKASKQATKFVEHDPLINNKSAKSEQNEPEDHIPSLSKADAGNSDRIPDDRLRKMAFSGLPVGTRNSPGVQEKGNSVNRKGIKPGSAIFANLVGSSKADGTKNQLSTMGPVPDQSVKDIPLTRSEPARNVQPDNSVSTDPKLSSKSVTDAQSTAPAKPADKRDSVSADGTKLHIPSKWSLGLSLSPSTAYTRRMNIGLGALVGYNVYKNFSLSTGILYNQYDAMNDAIPSGCGGCTTGGNIPVGTKILLSTDALFTGWEIPVEIRYRFAKGFSAGTGVSFFSLNNSKQNNNSLLAISSTRSIINSAGNMVTENFVAIVKVKEAVPQNSLKEKSSITFYTLSADYTLPGKKYALSFEPFLKLPVNNMTIGDFRIRGAGLNVNFMFKLNKPQP